MDKNRSHRIAVRLARLAPTVALLLLTAHRLAAADEAGAPPPDLLRQRIDGLVAVLTAGDPDGYERWAQEQLVPTLLARRTPEQRRQFLTRFRSDVGSIGEVNVAPTGPWAADVTLRGSGRATVVIHFALEPEPPHRVVNLGTSVEVGGDGPKSELPAPPDVRGVTDGTQLAKRLDPYLARLAADGGLSGVVSVAHDGQALYTRAYGLADEEKKVANTPSTRFNVASIGKIFTQVAVYQLVAQGQLALTDTVARRLPDYPNAAAAAKITVQQLLDHQAGVANIFGAPRDPDRPPRSNREWFARVAPLPLDFEPGTQTRYCNGCYVVLGEIVAAVSGRPYEKYLARHLFGPAGMTDTAFLAGSDPVAGQAVEYTRGPGGLEKTSLGPGAHGSAAGGVYSTVSDLLAFDNALRGYRLLDRQGTARVLGGDVEGPRAEAAIGIAGGAPGTSAVLESDERWTVVVLTNRDPRVGEDLGRALARALRD